MTYTEHPLRQKNAINWANVRTKAPWMSSVLQTDFLRMASVRRNALTFSQLAVTRPGTCFRVLRPRTLYLSCPRAGGG